MGERTVDIGRIGIWTGVMDVLPIDEARAAAREVEQLGYGALWIPETVGRDPFLLAAMLLDATETLPLATGIANIYARDPMTMVAAQKTLAEAFPGRFDPLRGESRIHRHLAEVVPRGPFREQEGGQRHSDQQGQS